MKRIVSLFCAIVVSVSILSVSFSAPVVPPVAPVKAVSDLKAELLNLNGMVSVTLSWNTDAAYPNIKDLVGFYVYKSNKTGAYGKYSMTDFPTVYKAKTKLTFVDSQVTASTVTKPSTYFYIVKVYTKTGQILESSNEAKINLTPLTIALQIGKPTFTVNGKNLQIDATDKTIVPILKNSRTMLPIRALVEAMGGTITFDDIKKEVSIKYLGKEVKMVIGKTSVLIDGKPSTILMDVAPEVINGRTYVPLRFLVEALGTNVFWDPAKNEVKITTLSFTNT